MRKLFALVLVVLMMFCSVATAESIDLTALTFEELIALRQEIDLLIFSSDEYKEVAVPAGDYVVGEDIPAGTYSLDSEGYGMISVYSDASKDIMGMSACHSVGGGETVGKIELKDGQVVEIQMASIIFKTYAGLGF